jgi:hypothetical protein
MSSGKLPNALYRNDGAGFFEDASAQIPSEAVSTSAVALADLDLDGDLDAVIGNYGGADLDRLYENQGGGWFADVTAPKLPPSGYTFAIAVGDLDGDGWPDLLLSGRLRLNSGGAFVGADALAPTPDFAARSIALGDLDGDGDLDALIDGDDVGRPRLWRGLLRQTARNGPARIGKPFALELRGPALAPYGLALAAAAGSVPLPPFGTLYLDPLSLHVLGGGALDSAGRALLVFGVPPDPAAVGTGIHLQALVGGQPAFTNREAVTLTDW